MSSLHSETLAVFCLGSNLGDRSNNLGRAGLLLEEKTGPVELVSPSYASPSWGYDSPNTYYNRCLSLLTILKPEEVMEIALGIELEMGRERSGSGYKDRIIDIDLLLFGSQVIQTERLVLPHPRMSERRFVLQPLADIYPGLNHPVLGKTIEQLLSECRDPSRLIPV